MAAEAKGTNVIWRMILILVAGFAALRANAAAPCAIQVIDTENGWPVPMVELRTNNQVRFVSDNAGRIAFDLRELMGRETWFNVWSDDYEVPADGFGYRGVRLTPAPGKKFTVKVHRTSIAKRLGRITGAGLFGESQKLGFETDWKETGVLGCDSVQNAVHDGRMFWLWGDTTLARYPLGIFDASSATSSIRPMEIFEPPLRLKLDYFRDDAGFPRGVAKMPGPGPTWLTGYVSLPDKAGHDHLVATYAKIKPPLEAYERGLCSWNEQTSRFEHLRTIWTKSDSASKATMSLQGHPVVVDDDDGRKWVLFGDPLPTVRCPASFEAWQNPSNWEKLTPQETIPSASDGKPIKPASGSIAWNAFRKRWVTVFLQSFGRPSAFGEIWYAEADSPYGPWGPAVKVLSHKNYTFYNPRLHPEFTQADSPILLFEGTHSTFLADRPEPTPRYDYNQILYRLDLDDPKLAPAHGTANGR
ncbi:MAG TPA: hypothetical protein VHE81_03260 [Lacipirellulaceae bacterium]|nr:hypothetical protein [Lacipirellulaceae bacterium]